MSGQPTDDFLIQWEIWWALLSGVVGTVALFCLNCWYGLDTLEREPQMVSPRERREAASSSSQALNPQQTVENAQRYQGIFTTVVGRMDYRSHWVLMHYLRGLLSLIGGRMFQYLDVDGVEVWYLRAVGRTFRYGVASSYERAQGARLLPGNGRGGQVYDIAQARISATPEEEEDANIDQVRHVDAMKDWTPWAQDVDLGLERESLASSSLSASCDALHLVLLGFLSLRGHPEKGTRI